jgi:hypothetical protein
MAKGSLSRHRDFTMVRIDELDKAIAEILQEYGDLVFEATAEGAVKGADVLVKKLKASSPKASGQYAKKWKREKGRSWGSSVRSYVGNTSTVKGGRGEDIALTNILEYSTDSKHQGLIKQTFLENVDKIAAAIVAEVKKV